MICNNLDECKCCDRMCECPDYLSAAENAAIAERDEACARAARLESEAAAMLEAVLKVNGEQCVLKAAFAEIRRWGDDPGFLVKKNREKACSRIEKRIARWHESLAAAWQPSAGRDLLARLERAEGRVGEMEAERDAARDCGRSEADGCGECQACLSGSVADVAVGMIEVQKRAGELEAALRELVALKFEVKPRDRAEYERRKPAAWESARALLSPAAPSAGKEGA